jgi:tRNA nucleotidyltransferase (CCA-adding enzyme)
VLEAAGLRSRLLPEIDSFGKLQGSLPQRFARLAWPLQESEVEALCERLRVPNEVRELALLACRNRVALRAARLATPHALLELIKRSDALRRPERFRELLEVAARDQPVVDTTRLERAFAAAASVKAGEVAAQAAKGKIAEAIDAARLAAIEQAL